MLTTIRGYRALGRRALAAGAWHSNRGRVALSVIGVALGVALGVAVHLINGSAIDEFAAASRALSGDADLVVRGPLGGFDEQVYPRIAALAGVDIASPALDMDVRIPGRRALHLVAIDPMQALRIQPGLLGDKLDGVRRLLEPDAVILSQAASEDLGVAEDGVLIAQAGTQPVQLHVIAVLSAAASAQRIAYADIATAQWKLQRLGVVDRIDVRLAPGADRAAVMSSIAALLPAGVHVDDVDAESREAVAMTRAYRINLDMLALVALFTGSFLVFATEALTILQRRTEIAILRVLGVTRAGIIRVLVIESAVVGALGALLGLIAGHALAWFALQRFGADLGAGYFSGMAVHLHPNPVALALYFFLGVGAAVAGCIAPAWRASSNAPAPALKAADVTETTAGERPVWPGVVLLSAAIPLAMLPPIDDLPLGGYAAVALLLAGALWLVPFVSERVLSRLPDVQNPIAMVALQQLRGTGNQLVISISAIVVSFSLMAAMLIMIGSFRGSLERWLDDILPADVYVRAGQSGFIDPPALRAIAALPSVARASAARSREIRPDAHRLPLTLLARDFNASEPGALPRNGSYAARPAGAEPPAWISEAAADLQRWKIGDKIALPLGGVVAKFEVAGIWRDYTRQNGTVLIERSRYVAVTGDTRVNDVWVWLAPGSSMATLAKEIEGALGGSRRVDVRDAASIRRLSLALFERTFAVTYVLEAVAVIIGLFGISVGFSSQVLARRAEFGVLRHIGVTRMQIGALLGIEGLVAGIVGIVYGLVTGGAISVLLVHVINRQSFHWSMDMHVPVIALMGVSVVLVLAATVTAVASGRQAMSGQPIAAVKDDW